VKNRKRWLDTLYWQYAWLLDAFGIDSPLAEACRSGFAHDADVRAVMGKARLLKGVLGSAIPSKWKIKKARKDHRLHPDRKPVPRGLGDPGDVRTGTFQDKESCP